MALIVIIFPPLTGSQSIVRLLLLLLLVVLRTQDLVFPPAYSGLFLLLVLLGLQDHLLFKTVLLLLPLRRGISSPDIGVRRWSLDWFSRCGTVRRATNNIGFLGAVENGQECAQ